MYTNFPRQFHPEQQILAYLEANKWVDSTDPDNSTVSWSKEHLTIVIWPEDRRLRDQIDMPRFSLWLVHDEDETSMIADNESWLVMQNLLNAIELAYK